MKSEKGPLTRSQKKLERDGWALHIVRSVPAVQDVHKAHQEKCPGYLAELERC